MNQNTLLWRQAHPNFMAGATITSQVFCPTPKDGNKLSVYDGDHVSALDSHTHYTETLGLESHSVWAVTKGEADNTGAPANDDPLPGMPHHAALDFANVVTEAMKRKIAKTLKKHALARGCQYPSA